MNYKLSPSDLTFLYDGCKHCFVLKVKHGISQPSIPLPAIFSTIGSLQKNYYSSKRTEAFCPELPPGVVMLGEKWVRSRTIDFSECSSSCFINGRFDIVANLDDGSYAVLDFKTGNPNEEKAGMYSRQLHAYAFSLENPADGALRLSPISRLGLLYFTPDKCEQIKIPRQILEGEMRWIEVERNDSVFLDLLRGMVSLLDGPLPPPEPETCNWCAYRERIRTVPVSTEPSAGSEVFASGSPPPTCPTCNGPMRLRSGRFGDFWSCMNYPQCKGTRNT